MSRPLKTADVAAEFDCSKVKVHELARSLGVGIDLGGSSGFRFTTAEVEKMREALRIQPPVAVRRRRRAG